MIASAPLCRGLLVVLALCALLAGCAGGGAKDTPPPAQASPPPAATRQPGDPVTLEDVQKELEWRRETKEKLDQSLN